MWIYSLLVKYLVFIMLVMFYNVSNVCVCSYSYGPYFGDFLKRFIHLKELQRASESERGPITGVESPAWLQGPGI